MPKEPNDKQIVDATKPLEAGPLKESGFRQLTVAELEALSYQDPEKAQTYLNLYEKLAARRKTEVNEAQIIAMSIMNLKQIQIEAEQQYRAQQGCEMRGHSRENGHGSALVGQRDNFHNLILVCQRCQKIFQGIGGAVGQLPLHLANSLDTTLIGGVQ